MAQTHQQLNLARPTGLQWFTIDELSPGGPIFLPCGQHVYQTLMDYLRKQYKLRNYQEVITPDIWKNKLWMMSGHYDNYRENMFPVFTHWPSDTADSHQSHPKWTIPKESFQNEKGERDYHDIGESYACKSMNCPIHYRIFGMHPRSYTELPLRIADFGTLHRNELVGSLRGLFRVRKFHQDDAHIFCTREQIAEEIRSFLTFLDDVYSLFGFDYSLELSTRPDKALNDEKNNKDAWDNAEATLKQELNNFGKPWSLNEGDGAFYGPKIDVHLTDSLGRSHQCGTIQLDFQLPERFDVWYKDEQNIKHRPAVLHRAIFGSLERFIGILIEHYQGKLPLWLSKKQFIVCSLYKKDQDQKQINKYITNIRTQLIKERWRMNVDMDISNTHIKTKVKNASDIGYHYILVVGGKEVDTKTIAVRKGRDVSYGQTLNDIIKLYDSEQK